MAGELAIEAAGLRKSFGSVAVLKGVDLAVPAGSLFALLGPNGAGKTTAVRILATLLTPDGGSARVAGHDVVDGRSLVRRSISLTGQYVALDELQTGEENLRMMGSLAGLSRSVSRQRTVDLLEQFGLSDAGKRRVSTYSGGMRRRLDLAASLVGRPSVIFLDEPTTGLDPRSRQAMWQTIRQLVQSGVTVFLTTQYLEEADQLASRIAVLDDGRIIAEGTATELKQQVAGQRLELELADPVAFDLAAQRLTGRLVLRDRDRLLLGVPVDGGAPELRQLLDNTDPAGNLITRFNIHSATLDDVFLALTGDAAGQTETEVVRVR